MPVLVPRHGERREQVRARWAEFFRDYDILLCPVILSAAIDGMAAAEAWLRRG